MTLQWIEGSRVCLTFDDGPDPVYTPRVLDQLATHACKATFFVLGESARRHPELIKRIHNEGHTLGNHSFDHPRSRAGCEDEDARQLCLTQQVVEEICGERMRWFRPPYGQLTAGHTHEAARLGLTPVLWSRSAIDWGPLATKRGVTRRLRRTVAGDILLLHDAPRRHNRPHIMLAVLPELLVQLRNGGIAVISLDQYAAAS